MVGVNFQSKPAHVFVWNAC